MELRPCTNKDNNILVSPCDAKVLSISKINSLNSLILVKNVKYSICEFLFGPSPVNQFISDINDLHLSKDLYQITLYLSPGDCHRYFSSTQMHVKNRIYNPGFLLPVKPSYVNNHPDTYKINERVTIKGDIFNSDNVLYTTYVGALNVGSINLNFDDFLTTNQRIDEKDLKANKGSFVLFYNQLMAGTKTIEKEKLFFYKPKISLLFESMINEMEEFDIRDMVDIDSINLQSEKSKELSLNSAFDNLESNLKYKYENSFMSYDSIIYSLKKKFENPKQLKVEKYEVSSKGILLKRLEEVGWFNFGSSIVLIFSVDRNKEIKFNFKPGDKVKIGEDLYKLN